jgi:hypothetical protein
MFAGVSRFRQAEANRSDSPVEAFRFSAASAAVGLLAEVLRDLCVPEPRATVAVLARYGEEADRVRQVKGLELDYVLGDFSPAGRERRCTCARAPTNRGHSVQEAFME